MDLGLHNKTAIVTGATSNIGRAIALVLAGEGVKLLAVGRDSNAGQRLLDEALAAGASAAEFLQIDLRNADAGTRVAQRCIDLWQGIDILVNNVGGNNAMGLFAESDPASWQADIDINLSTVLKVTHAVLPSMIAANSGRIINIGSTAGEVGDYMLALYSAAKAAVHGFTKVLAKEVGQHNITVNCVAPYATLPEDPATLSSGSRFHPESGFFTKTMATIAPTEIAKLVRTGPLPRSTAKAPEVAAAVAYLASQQAGFVTGQIHYIDGGTLL